MEVEKKICIFLFPLYLKFILLLVLYVDDKKSTNW